MQAYHVRISPCAGPTVLYSLFCNNPDRGDSERSHLLHGFQYLHLQVSNIEFLEYSHGLQLGNGAAFLPRVPVPRADISKRHTRDPQRGSAHGHPCDVTRIWFKNWTRIFFGSQSFLPPFFNNILFILFLIEASSSCHNHLLLPAALQMSSMT